MDVESYTSHLTFNQSIELSKNELVGMKVVRNNINIRTDFHFERRIVSL